jgi:outer membrane biogenesis lipoprotein LolB
MQFIAVLLLAAAVLSGCATGKSRTARVQQEQKRLDKLLEHNRVLLENIRWYEAKLDTLEKMRQGQLKALYRVR